VFVFFRFGAGFDEETAEIGKVEGLVLNSLISIATKRAGELAMAT